MIDSRASPGAGQVPIGFCTAAQILQLVRIGGGAFQANHHQHFVSDALPEHVVHSEIAALDCEGAVPADEALGGGRVGACVLKLDRERLCLPQKRELAVHFIVSIGNPCRAAALEGDGGLLRRAEEISGAQMVVTLLISRVDALRMNLRVDPEFLRRFEIRIHLSGNVIETPIQVRRVPIHYAESDRRIHRVDIAERGAPTVLGRKRQEYR